MDFLPSHRLRSLMAGRNRTSTEKGGSVIPAFLVRKRFQQVHLPVQCAFQGCHAPEQIDGRCFFWTTARSVLTCRLRTPERIQVAWLELEATAPDGSTVSVLWNEQRLIDKRQVRGRVTLALRLPQPITTDCTQISIESTTFVPRSLGMGTDTRCLGVAVRGIILAKRRSKYRARSAFPIPLKTRLYKILPKWSRRALPSRHSSSARRAA